MKLFIHYVAVGILLFSGAVQSKASIIVAPDLAPGTQYRLAFVTEGARTADEPGIEIYNSFVTTQANLSPVLATLGLSWSVIGSTPTENAKTNTGTDPQVATGVPIYNLAGERVAVDNADLWDGQIENAIDVDQFGNTWFGRVVLTGTGVDGSGIEYRQYSGPNSFRVQYGYSDQTGGGWVNVNDYQGIGAARQYYAISSVLVAAPEPASLALVAMGSLMVIRRQ